MMAVVILQVEMVVMVVVVGMVGMEMVGMVGMVFGQIIQQTMNRFIQLSHTY